MNWTLSDTSVDSIVDTEILSFPIMKQKKYHSVFYILRETLELRVYGGLYWVHLVKLELIFCKPPSFCGLGLESTRERCMEDESLIVAAVLWWRVWGVVRNIDVVTCASFSSMSLAHPPDYWPWPHYMVPHQ